MEAARDEPFEIGILRLPARGELCHVRDDVPDLRVTRVAGLEHREGSLVGRNCRVVLAAEPPDASDEVEGFDRLGRAVELFVQLEGLLGEPERLHVRVDRGRALGGLPRILGRLFRHVSEQVVVG